jgi:hypothetical protein
MLKAVPHTKKKKEKGNMGGDSDGKRVDRICTNREANGTDEVPEADVPAENAESWSVPVWLGFEHE